MHAIKVREVQLHTWTSENAKCSCLSLPLLKVMIEVAEAKPDSTVDLDFMKVQLHKIIRFNSNECFLFF
jgi:hypothetical protein